MDETSKIVLASLRESAEDIFSRYESADLVKKNDFYSGAWCALTMLLDELAAPDVESKGAADMVLNVTRRFTTRFKGEDLSNAV